MMDKEIQRQMLISRTYGALALTALLGLGLGYMIRKRQQARKEEDDTKPKDN